MHRGKQWVVGGTSVRAAASSVFFEIDNIVIVLVISHSVFGILRVLPNLLAQLLLVVGSLRVLALGLVEGISSGADSHKVTVAVI